MGIGFAALEALDVNADFWRGHRVLLTGHTGFKGSWLALWLHTLGAKVFGLALAPDTEPSLYESAGLEACVKSTYADIRDPAAVRSAFASAKPVIVIHLAAQSIVRRGYAQPVETFATNVMGTVHVLDEARRSGVTEAVLVVTSDKCYDDRNPGDGFREEDPLGGRDPYSASKASAEIVTRSFRESFSAEASKRPAIATARSGNVIGGGDWAQDRLLPDAVRAWTRGVPVTVRNPEATRPWQHVLDPLAGYLGVCERLARGDAGARCAWNFGPGKDQSRTVAWILDEARARWGEGAAWTLGSDNGPRELQFLRLDASKAQRELGWRPRLLAEQALAWTIDWYKSHRDAPNGARELCQAQIERYASLARQ